MSENRSSDYIDHIKIAVKDALAFVEGMSKDDFLNDKRTQNAVVMCLLVIGEASAKLMDKCPEYADSHPQIQWRNMRGMRNRIAHGYFEINLELVWETTQVALPDLLSALKQLPSA